MQYSAQAQLSTSLTWGFNWNTVITLMTGTPKYLFSCVCQLIRCTSHAVSSLTNHSCSWGGTAYMDNRATTYRPLLRESDISCSCSNTDVFLRPFHLPVKLLQEYRLACGCRLCVPSGLSRVFHFLLTKQQERAHRPFSLLSSFCSAAICF